MADDTAQIAFDSAIREFKLKLNDPRVYADILQTTSIDQVYDATDKIQEEQSKKGHLRDLARIAPFLARLNDYAGSIEVFVQVKPEILALIWGPIKLLLQWASAVKTSYDAIISTTAEIGVLLPEFKKSAQMFHENKQINHVLALYFKDIMDFYVIALKFFKQSGLKHMFEALWPKQREKIKLVTDNIQNHTRLMRNEVQFEHIQREHDARLRQLEEAESRRKAQIRQDYEYVKTDLAPKFFNDALYRLSGQVCQGTGKWLLEDEKFIRWFNTADKAVRILWLQGIPGAGKTFLSATVISQAMRSGTVAFALISYTTSGSTTALSIIHSLIFQLVSQDENRQAVLLETTQDNLKIDISSATNILTTILGCSGPSYIIIDGLDEIEESERGRLLTQLIEATKACEDVNIFISSRPEADISTKLSQEATIIRVDHRNYGSIQVFVEEWTEKWFDERDFLHDDQIEIKARLASLASKSKGMFLYAKLILSSIEFMEDFSDIHRELAVLPETLEAAYGRILERINGSQIPVRKDIARKIIGWVACTPTPLTVQELQRALTIKEGVKHGNLRVRGNLPLVRLCGPIVEIADDYVQFVHFTAKEYLTSPRIAGSIAISEATLSLATCCMTYLCQTHHDLGFTNEEICSNILNGLYVLHDFASTMWFKLVESCLNEYRVETTPDRLIKALKTHRELRENANYSGEISGNSSLLVTVSRVSLPADIKAFLSQADQFRRISAASEHRLDQSTSWINLDPTTHSRLSAKIEHAVESLVKAEEPEIKEHIKCLNHWYGARPFKCRFIHCSSRRDGFEETSDRKSHERHHDRPWKCSFPGCTFSEGGFLSRKMRDNHLDDFHRNQKDDSVTPLPTDSSELLPLLFDLVKSDQVDAVTTLLELPESQSSKVVSKESKIELCKIAGYSGSTAMIDALVNAFFSWSLSDIKTRMGSYHTGHMWNTTIGAASWRLGILESSILGKNVDIFRFLLSKYSELSVLCWQFFCAVVQSDSEELYDIWETRVIKAADFSRTGLNSSVLAKYYLIRRDFIQATASMPNREQLLLNHWKRVNIARLGGKYLGDALVYVASTTQSISLAHYLLEIGAPVDHRRSSAYLTPLHCAAKVDSERAAEFLKFLLYKGANAETDSKKIHIRDEPGVKGISRWLQLTWDELIAQVKKETAVASI